MTTTTSTTGGGGGLIIPSLIVEEKSWPNDHTPMGAAVDTSQSVNDKVTDPRDDGTDKDYVTQQRKPNDAQGQQRRREPPHQKQQDSSAISVWMFRVFWLEIPLLVAFVLFVSVLAWERYGYQYLLPQMQLMHWSPNRAEKELTYYHRICHADDQSTDTATDLLVDYQSMTPKDTEDIMLRHGAAVFPHLLSDETANQLRSYILKENKRMKDMIYVIQNENRWSFFLRVDQDPIVTKALKELLNDSNPLLRQTLERICGENPAVIEFTTITSAYGAKAQHWHQDVVPETNGAKYSRNYIPSYSLFIPLQDTTAGMGATGICPGTHMCAAGCSEFCPHTGFQMSKAGGNTTTEYWPLGWGALVNQQTTHIGMAHTDPRAPHRVVFILTFAPRPRTGHQEVETRMIGGGGSYSLHWSQWGHTLNEFANPDQYMRQPWRTLKSLGLYKAPGTDWGWDFFTQAIGRIANADTGYYRSDFDEFWEKGGFFFLPRILQGSLPSEDLGDAETWIDFMIQTTRKCHVAVQYTYTGLLAVYVFWVMMQWHTNHDNLRRSVVYIAILHATIALLATWLFTKTERRSWAHNIRHGRLFNASTGPHLVLPNIPASLPLEQDILILNDMQSKYMASFSRVLEVAHPGNRAWNNVLDHSWKGYHQLPAPMQQTLRSFLLNQAGKEHQRIMTKNTFGNWAEVDTDIADSYCHKQLMYRSHPTVAKTVRLIDYLLSETRYGYWRESIMHLKHIPALLVKLHDSILRKQRVDRKVSKRIQYTWLYKVSSFLPEKHSSLLESRKRLAFPPSTVNLEPFPNAWFKEGDIVEATYESMFEGMSP